MPHHLQSPTSRTVVSPPTQNAAGIWSQFIQCYVDGGAKVLDLILYSPVKQPLIPSGEYRAPQIIDVALHRDDGSQDPSEEPDPFVHLPGEGEALQEDHGT